MTSVAIADQAALPAIAYQHVIIDPDPAPPGDDLLEKGLADLNGDGQPDAVLGLGNAAPGGLNWYQSPASGVLTDPWVKHVIAATGNFYEDLTFADLNGDGATDVIASVDGTVSWFENPAGQGGDPGAGPWTQHLIRADGAAHAMALADMDGDGQLDVVGAGSAEEGSQAAILFQDSPDSWTELPLPGAGDGIALLDAGTGTGIEDIVAAVGDNIVLFHNPRETGGDPRHDPWVPQVIATLPHAAQDPIATGVFTPGGRMDVLVASGEGYPDNPPGLYRLVAPADPQGSWTVQVLDPTFAAVHRISVADMNGDGLTDVVLSEQEQAHNAPPDFDQSFDQQRVAIFLNQGNGTFAEQVVATTGGHNQVVGDVNGDGYPDILSANHGVFGAPHPLELWLSQPAAAPWP